MVAGDALALDLAALVPAPRVVVANLPYNVATPLLIGWLRQAALWERLTLMFQLEVAERICAAPGSPAYGRLAVLAQWTGTAAVLTRIPAAAFWPPPKVVSAVIGFVPHAGAAAAGAVRHHGTADRRRLRPAPQDAARLAARAGRRGAAGPGRHRSRTAGRRR